MSESDGSVKVIDKRIFTSDGELREGFEHLDKPAAEIGSDGHRPAPAENEAAAPKSPEPSPKPSPEPGPALAAEPSRQSASPDAVFGPATSGRESGPATSGRESGPATSGPESGPATSGRESGPATSSPESGPATSGRESGPATSGRESGPATSGPESGPSFFDLVGVLAEPIPLFLGDAKLPDGASAENLELARFHIDLLEVIETKTAGNLSSEESALMEDLLYRLRLRYVQKTS